MDLSNIALIRSFIHSRCLQFVVFILAAPLSALEIKYRMTLKPTSIFDGSVCVSLEWGELESKYWLNNESQGQVWD